MKVLKLFIPLLFIAQAYANQYILEDGTVINNHGPIDFHGEPYVEREDGKKIFADVRAWGSWMTQPEQQQKRLNESNPAGTFVVGPTSTTEGCGPVGSSYDPNGESDELVAAIFAAQMSSELCKPEGSKMPPSMDTWWKAVKKYSEGEKARHAKSDSAIAALKSRMDAILADKSGNKNLQIEGNQIQLEMTNLTIQDVTERIRLRNELFTAGNKSMSQSTEENTKNVNTYKEKLILEGLEKSLKVAEEACKRTKKVKECTKDTDEEKCEEKIVPDPVPGCKEAIAAIPAIRSGVVQEYGEFYLNVSGPSKTLNDGLKKFEEKMIESMRAVPKSDDAKFDWHSPMLDGQKAMAKQRKDNGVACKIIKVDKDTIDKLNAEDKKTLKKLNDGIAQFDLAKPTMSGEKLKSTFELGDMYIGQPYKRLKYIEYFTEHISYIACHDEAALKTAQDNMTKLIKYGKEIAKATTNPPSTGGSSSNGGAGVTAPKQTPGQTPSTSGNGGIGSSNVVINSSISSNALPTNGGSSTASLPGNSPTALPGASGEATGTASSGSNFISGSSIGSNSNMKSRQAIMQTSKLAYDKAEAAFANYIKLAADKNLPNTEVVKSTTTKKKAPVDPSFSERMQSITLSPVDSSDASAFSTASFIDPAYQNKNSPNDSYPHSGTSGSSNRTFGTNTPAGAAATATTASKTTTRVLGYSSSAPSRISRSGMDNSVKSPARPKSKERVEAEQLVRESIQAKNTHTNQFIPTEDDSLFDRVTKAYVRNYEKVSEDISDK